MQLQDLNLNRYLYRVTTSTDTQDSSTMSSNSGQVVPSGNAGGPGGIVTSQLISGTILQTSGSDNRVEMNPNDTLVAYNNGNIVLTIDRNGITVNNAVVIFVNIQHAVITLADITTANITTANIGTENTNTANITTANIGSETVGSSNITTANIGTANIGVANITTDNVDTLNVGDENISGTVIKHGTTQPTVYPVWLASGGALIFAPTGWSSAFISIGTYLITHNLGTSLVIGTVQTYNDELITGYSVVDANSVLVTLKRSSTTVTGGVAANASCMVTLFSFP